MPAARRCCASGRCGRWSTGSRRCCPTARSMMGLSGLKKDNRGYSLDQLLVGAEGTLGIVTAARLKLVPAIHSRAVAWLGLASPQAALDTLRALEARNRPRRGVRDPAPGVAGGGARAHPGHARAARQRHAWHALVEATADGAEAEPPADLLDPAAGAADRARPGRGRGDFGQRGAGRGLLAHPRQPVRGGAGGVRPGDPARHQRRGRRHAAVHGRGGGRGGAGLSRHQRLGLRPSGRRQHPFPRPRRGRAAARLATSARGRRSRGWSTIW